MGLPCLLQQTGCAGCGFPLSAEMTGWGACVALAVIPAQAGIQGVWEVRYLNRSRAKIVNLSEYGFPLSPVCPCLASFSRQVSRRARFTPIWSAASSARRGSPGSCASAFLYDACPWGFRQGAGFSRKFSASTGCNEMGREDESAFQCGLGRILPVARCDARYNICSAVSTSASRPSCQRLNGFSTSTSNWRKSPTFLLTTVSLCTMAVAAIMASSISVSDFRCLSRAHSRNAAASIGSTP